MPTGRCCCGASSVTVAGDPAFGAICHCGDCRRRSGSAFGWSSYFPVDRVTGPDGPVAQYSPAVDAPQDRWFCRECGTTLAWRTGRFPGMVGVAAGTFADDPLPPPTIANQAGSCEDWITLPADWRHIG